MILCNLIMYYNVWSGSKVRNRFPEAVQNVLVVRTESQSNTLKILNEVVRYRYINIINLSYGILRIKFKKMGLKERKK